MTSKEIEFNEDELTPPDWLNKDFFVKVLKNCEKARNVLIKNLQFSPGTGKNDHYASIMFRVVVDYISDDQTKKISLIVKTMPHVDGPKLDVLKDSHIFETEISIYTKVLPRFSSILKQAGDDTLIGPKCLYYELSPIKVIVFEDLVPQGYVVLRERFPNLDEVRLAYSKIAKWHAISYKLNLEEPKFFENYHHGVFNTPNIKEMESFVDGIKNFIDLLDNNADLVKYKPYFLPLKDNIMDYCEKVCTEYREEPLSDAMYVLCHGDFHYKNMMFKHNTQTGSLDDLLLLDYQVSFMGQIGSDILYSMYMLLDEELRAKNIDELLYFYCKTFQETLKKIGFTKPIPTIMKLRQELLRQTQYHLFLFTTFRPTVLYAWKGKGDIADLLTVADVRKQMFKEPDYINEVRRLLPQLLHAGFLEN